MKRLLTLVALFAAVSAEAINTQGGIQRQSNIGGSPSTWTPMRLGQNGGGVQKLRPGQNGGGVQKLRPGQNGGGVQKLRPGQNGGGVRKPVLQANSYVGGVY